MELTKRDVSVLFVGIGNDEKKIKEDVKYLSLEGAVHFTGYRKDVADILASADVSVLTSKFEGVPRALMESMASGLPVIATDVPGTRMLVQPGVTGLLVKDGDVEALANSLMKVMENTELARKLGKNGKNRIQTKFDECLVVERIQQVYDYLLRGKSGYLPDWNVEHEAKL